MLRSGNPPGSTVRQALCPHRLGQHLTRSAKSTATYPDGATRPNRLRGGTTVVAQSSCVGGGGHDGEHRTSDGRTWS